MTFIARNKFSDTFDFFDELSEIFPSTRLLYKTVLSHIYCPTYTDKTEVLLTIST